MPIKTLFIASLALLLTAPIFAAADWGKPPASFEKGDVNRDGTLDRSEYNRIVIDEFRSHDLNKDGYLTFDEMDERQRTFLFKKEERRAQERINEADYLRKHYRPFNHYDLNQDGSLSPSEYRGWGL